MLLLAPPRCAARAPWMVGNCTRLPLGTTTPPTLANDERSGTLAVGANLYETDLSEAVPFFAVDIRAQKVGAWAS